MVDILTGVPSIVAALFVYAVGSPSSAGAQRVRGVAGPGAADGAVVVRSTEENAQDRPDDLREASYALGVPKWRTILKIVHSDRAVRHAHRDRAGTGPIMGETAPVLILVAYAPYINFNLFSGNMASLPLLMTVERSNPTAAGSDRIGLGADPDPAHHDLPADRRRAVQA